MNTNMSYYQPPYGCLVLQSQQVFAAAGRLEDRHTGGWRNRNIGSSSSMMWIEGSLMIDPCQGELCGLSEWSYQN